MTRTTPDRPRPPRPRLADPATARRLGRVAAWGLGLVLAAVATFSALVVWHLVRRGRLIRDRLGPPRALDWPAEGDRP